MKPKLMHDRALLTLTGQFIRSRRKQLGYNSRGVAAAVNVSQPVISNIELGRYPGLKFETLFSILLFLEVSISDLEEYLERTKNL